MGPFLSGLSHLIMWFNSKKIKVETSLATYVKAFDQAKQEHFPKEYFPRGVRGTLDQVKKNLPQYNFFLKIYEMCASKLSVCIDSLNQLKHISRGALNEKETLITLVGELLYLSEKLLEHIRNSIQAIAQPTQIQNLQMLLEKKRDRLATRQKGAQCCFLGDLEAVIEAIVMIVKYSREQGESHYLVLNRQKMGINMMLQDLSAMKVETQALHMHRSSRSQLPRQVKGRMSVIRKMEKRQELLCELRFFVSESEVDSLEEVRDDIYARIQWFWRNTA